jgi:putative transposase
MTGVQALERLYAGLPMEPGKVECREFDYARHGTLTFTLNLDVPTGESVAPTCGDTRGNEDFARHIQRTVETDLEAIRWHFVMDNLSTHRSAPLVRYVAAVSGVEEDLGIEGKSGILHNKKTRTAFLINPEHKIVFHYTPKHCSWLNQIEIWLSILARKVIRRGNFTSKEDLRDKVLAFIEYFTRTMAKPFRWIYKGKPLTA